MPSLIGLRRLSAKGRNAMAAKTKAKKGKGGLKTTLRYTMKTLRDRLYPFMDQESTLLDSVNPDESAWKFYNLNESSLQEMAVPAIVHVISDYIKHIVNERRRASTEQLRLPMAMQNYSIPGWFAIRTESGQKRYVPAFKSTWIHVCARDDEKQKGAEHATEEAQESRRLKEFLEPYMSTSPNVTLQHVCDALLDQEKRAS